jgi:putative thiamine transport system substrate-binding protein
MRQTFLRGVLTVLVLALGTVAAGPAAAQTATTEAATSQAENWPATLAAARGQTVYWHAWAGDEKINRYIDWVAGTVRDRFGVDLRHVKVAQTGEVVALVLAEKAAGRTTGGSVDLVWLNGENFAAMKQNGLLSGPFTDRLPHFRLVDTTGKPTTLVDFTVPTDGLESPWGMAQLTFYYDSARLDAPPRSIAALGEWAKAHPGRFTYPAPPDFIGATFLKQALIALTPDPAVLQSPPADDAAFVAATAPLWQWLDTLHPRLWRDGRAFPTNHPALRQLVDDGATDIGFAFNPIEAASAIEQGLLPDSVRPYGLDGGSIGNTHFVAIPFNAKARDGALVVADFLLSPEAQARKADPAIWGDPTVLDPAKLTPDQRALFKDVAMPADLGPPLPEPHPAWMVALEQAWLKRYSR